MKRISFISLSEFHLDSPEIFSIVFFFNNLFIESDGDHLTVAPFFVHFFQDVISEIFIRSFYNASWFGFFLTGFPWFTRVCWSVWFCLSATGPYPSEKNVANKRFSFSSHWNTHLPFWSTFSTRVHLKSHFRKMCTRRGLIKGPLKAPKEHHVMGSFWP